MGVHNVHCILAVLPSTGIHDDRRKLIVPDKRDDDKANGVKK